jgi:enoyl-[acyl-carrier protein] reductase II
MLGAAGVQMGTRFLVATESKIHPDYKQAVLKAKDIDTVVTGEYAGHPARVLKNKMAKQFMRLEKAEAAKAHPDFTEVEQIGNGSLRNAVLTGDATTGAYMAGQVAGMVTKAESAADILADIYTQANQLMGRE